MPTFCAAQKAQRRFRAFFLFSTPLVAVAERLTALGAPLLAPAMTGVAGCTTFESDGPRGAGEVKRSFPGCPVIFSFSAETRPGFLLEGDICKGPEETGFPEIVGGALATNVVMGWGAESAPGAALDSGLGEGDTDGESASGVLNSGGGTWLNKG